jgi:hypothetical protein
MHGPMNIKFTYVCSVSWFIESLYLCTNLYIANSVELIKASDIILLDYTLNLS